MKTDVMTETMMVLLKLFGAIEGGSVVGSVDGAIEGSNMLSCFGFIVRKLDVVGDFVGGDMVMVEIVSIAVF